jgi:hypothetical protein
MIPKAVKNAESFSQKDLNSSNLSVCYVTDKNSGSVAEQGLCASSPSRHPLKARYGFSEPLIQGKRVFTCMKNQKVHIYCLEEILQ